jgi:glycine amidinotransferase
VQDCPVNSHNEWDPLEEVIVGRLEGAVIPSSHIGVSISVPKRVRKIFSLVSGMRYPQFLIRPAQRELEGLAHLLESEGVKVRMPDILDGRQMIQTPNWKSRGFCTACPRDLFLIVGDEIIETPLRGVPGLPAPVQGIPQGRRALARGAQAEP